MSEPVRWLSPEDVANLPRCAHGEVKGFHCGQCEREETETAEKKRTHNRTWWQANVRAVARKHFRRTRYHVAAGSAVEAGDYARKAASIVLGSHPDLLPEGSKERETAEFWVAWWEQYYKTGSVKLNRKQP